MWAISGRNSGSPAWSPAGNQIAFGRSDDVIDGASAIYVVAPDGSGLRRLTRKGLDGVPVWSPDGKRIAIDSLINGIYVMAADGSGLRRLTRGRSDGFPAWSPDGRQIAFTRLIPLGNREARTDIYVVGVDGSGLRRLTCTRVQNEFPTWSPDGKQIAFVAWPERSPLDCPAAAIYVMAPGGSGQRRLTRYRTVYGYPTWSPDGREIAFTTPRDRECWSESEKWDIYVMAADGSAHRRLTRDTHAWSGTYLAWQPAQR